MEKNKQCIVIIVNESQHMGRLTAYFISTGLKGSHSALWNCKSIRVIQVPTEQKCGTKPADPGWVKHFHLLLLESKEEARLIRTYPGFSIPSNWSKKTLKGKELLDVLLLPNRGLGLGKGIAPRTGQRGRNRYYKSNLASRAWQARSWQGSGSLSGQIIG